jgi:hypothetical protein
MRVLAADEHKKRERYLVLIAQLIFFIETRTLNSSHGSLRPAQSTKGCFQKSWLPLFALSAT